MKIHKMIFMAAMATLALLEASAVLTPPEILYYAVEQEIEHAKLELDNNKASSALVITSLKTKLDDIWMRMKKEDLCEDLGMDADLRPAYIIMQGILEKALLTVLEKGEMTGISGAIVAPRMPTPLILEGSSSLSEINVNDPRELARYRNAILVDFLKTGSRLEVFYSHDAGTALSSQDLGFYESYRASYPNLIDAPIIDIDMKHFPVEMTGAIYWFDKFPIFSIESRQVDQFDDEKLAEQQVWAIKWGPQAAIRKLKIDAFLKEYL